ncbi:hypothetical protein L917_18819 [Phytophthora nicotianae]|uniref:Apple domain-containing protein n=2 Tax=Phytophthora nicotianae TaxID=4792 RepID=W2K697_PHYNI|nr:hypothetical protein L917_18819 [Phytophthora nicotianae]ETO62458.1 hypothetical protein F444_19640 [Phytophthora nicotianae P1976]
MAFSLLLPVIWSFAIAVPEECVVENGFDYMGNDLFSLASVDAFECCHQCQNFADAGCRAYSWTDYQGGTCWLKTGRGTIAVNANVKSGTISTFRFVETCVLEDGIDYEGNDIANVQANDAGECCSICEQVPGCRAFTFTKHGGGTCWLKSAKGNMVLELNVDYSGTNIGNASSVNAYGCCSICMKKAGCVAFSWTDLNGGICYLKSEKGNARLSDRFMSSVV